MAPPLISVTQLDREKRRGRFKGYERVKICADDHRRRRQMEKHTHGCLTHLIWIKLSINQV